MSPAMLALALAAQSAGPALPPPAWREGDWLVVLVDGQTELAIDRATLRLDGAMVLVRLRGDFPGMHRGIRWGVSTLEVGCADRSSRVIEVSEFDAEGTFTPREVPPSAERIPLGPEATGLVASICRAAGWPGTVPAQ